MTYFVGSSIVQAIQKCENITESKVYNIMQLIIAGKKSSENFKFKLFKRLYFRTEIGSFRILRSWCYSLGSAVSIGQSQGQSGQSGLRENFYTILRLSVREMINFQVLKVLGKTCKKRTKENSLSVLLVLFRTQRHVIDKQKVRTLEFHINL